MLMMDFLHKVDRLTAAMNKDQLVCFIHNEARLLDEDERDEFLTRLDGFANPAAKKNMHDQFEQMADEMTENLSSIYEQLDNIKSGEVFLTGDYNEEYDDWYNYEADMYIYHDPDHIADTILSACQMLHTLIDWEKYDEALKLSRTLLELSIDVENEYDDEESFSIGDLFDYELIFADYENVVIDMLYAAYMALPSSERAETVYHFMELSECDDINLEKLMQHSTHELPNMPEFLDHWIEVLSDKSGNLPEMLLRESVAMITDNEKLLKYAEKYSNTHPCIYEALLQNHHYADTKNALQIGTKALKNIPVKYAIRNNIALMTAEYALALNDIEAAEHCWLEAFRSTPTAVNLLRLMTMCRNFTDIEHDVRTIISLNDKNRQPFAYVPERAKELGSYYLSSEDKYRLLFLLGNYIDILKNEMKPLKKLGWSGTFLKCGIPLFLLLMYNGTDLGSAMMKMCKIVSEYMSFHAENYFCGTQIKPSESSDEILFWQLFKQTRCTDKLSDDEQKNIMERLSDLIELRTNLIVSGQKRGCYDECAAYIAALGEVKESHYEECAKQELLYLYKTKYPRHSAFIRELKNFGLK